MKKTFRLCGLLISLVSLFANGGQNETLVNNLEKDTVLQHLANDDNELLSFSSLSLTTDEINLLLSQTIRSANFVAEIQNMDKSKSLTSNFVDSMNKSDKLINIIDIINASSKNNLYYFFVFQNKNNENLSMVITNSDIFPDEKTRNFFQTYGFNGLTANDDVNSIQAPCGLINVPDEHGNMQKAIVVDENLCIYMNLAHEISLKITSYFNKKDSINYDLSDLSTVLSAEDLDELMNTNIKVVNSIVPQLKDFFAQFKNTNEEKVDPAPESNSEVDDLDQDSPAQENIETQPIEDDIKPTLVEKQESKPVVSVVETLINEFNNEYVDDNNS